MDITDAAVEIDNLRAENDRLRGENHRLLSWAPLATAENERVHVAELHAKIERQREANAALLAKIDAVRAAINDLPGLVADDDLLAVLIGAFNTALAEPS